MTVDWFCESNVVASVMRHLQREGWTIESVANTESRERGADIRAKRGSETLIVEAKGYPSDVYARGPNKGEPKPTKPGVQARHWYSHVLLDAVIRQSEFPSAGVVIALPKFPVFTKMLERTDHALQKLGIGVYLVSDLDSVEVIKDASGRN